MDEIIVKKDGFAWIQAEPLLQKGLLHGFSTRLGGTSRGFYESLNLGLHVNDVQERVLKNREAWASALGFDLDKSVWGEQVHGSNSVYVTKEHCGRGARTFASTMPGVDALFTNQPGIPLVAVFADCVPVLLYDRSAGCIGVVHAGWRGIVAHNTERTIEGMETLVGVKRENLQIYVGPCISQDYYGVDENVKRRFEDAGYGKNIAERNGLHYIDLRNCLAEALLEFGIARKNVCVSTHCTYREETLFFSHRRDKGQTGRMAGVIMMDWREIEK
ncbi:peptidoglycan editing factor PgeF [Clostridia bacterium]|nr:peptidoglycan editing factor PgeF [Clostridia bacterium]